jgi:hypothetical protein
MPLEGNGGQRRLGWGRRQSRWLRTADGFAVCAASVNSILKRSATRLAYTNGERVLTKGWLSLAGAALNLHPMAEGICHDALSFRASTIGRGSLLLYVCLGGRADGDYESSLEIHVRQAFAGMAALMFCAFSAATAAAMDRGQFQNVPPEIREWFENMRSPKGIVWATFDFHRPAFPVASRRLGPSRKYNSLARCYYLDGDLPRPPSPRRR